MYYDNSHGATRLGLSSVVLLTIFVSAFALIVVAALWRPWAEDDDAPDVVPPITLEEPVVDGAQPADVDAVPVTP
jgi:hypothetical protein